MAQKNDRTPPMMCKGQLLPTQNIKFLFSLFVAFLRVLECSRNTLDIFLVFDRKF
jgi:hypothetical protein